MINSSKKQEISELVDIDLSSGEDSVTSLGIAQADESSAIVLAGINSAEKEQAAGKNEHLRSFRLGYPPKRNADGEKEGSIPVPAKTEALSKASLFSAAASSDKHETYQRLLRLSRANPESSKRIGAVATGLAPAGEIVVFDATNPRPSASDIRKRIVLDKGQEAADVDVIARSDEEYLVAYCTAHEVSLAVVPADRAAKPRAPYLLHGTPHPDVFADKTRPTFRGLRFLTPSLILLARSLPARAGAELLLLDVPAEPIPGAITLRKRLPKSSLGVAALAVSPLASPLPASPIQHVIALATQEKSLHLFTLDHEPSNKPPRGPLRPFLKLPNLYAFPASALALSTHHCPRDRRTAAPQYLKLASASPAGRVLVHTFPLAPYPADPSQHTSENPTRYALRPLGRSREAASNALGLVMAVLLVTLGGVLLQAFTEIRGGTAEILGAKAWLPARVRNWMAVDYMFKEGLPERVVEARRRYGIEREQRMVREGAVRLRDALDWRRKKAGVEEEGSAAKGEGEKEEGPKAVLITQGEGEKLTADMVEKEHAEGQAARPWEELNAEEKKTWRGKMMDAGVWAVEEGENVLKGEFPSASGSMGPHADHLSQASFSGSWRVLSLAL